MYNILTNNIIGNITKLHCRIECNSTVAEQLIFSAFVAKLYLIVIRGRKPSENIANIFFRKKKVSNKKNL